ncbi:MAG: flippase-like domain-containing protein [Chitinophagaceae bacterium]|nr:flippase-like domain-containing protein [Chitinophagaceae bacterium]
MLIQNKNIKLILNYVAGPLVFCILAYAIYVQIQKQDDWRVSLHNILHVFNSAEAWKLIAVFLLMFVNWGIESRKWQISLSQSRKISFKTSFKAIFSGTTMAFFTPNRIGEYMGRMLHLERKDRLPSIGLTVISSISQLLVTIIVGTIGLLILRQKIASAYPTPNVIFWINLLLYLLGGVSIILTLFYFRFSSMIRWIDRVPAISRWTRYIRTLESFNATILLRLLSLSLTRYLVFITQYFLLFNVFGVELGWWQSFWSVSVVFLVIAIIPSVAALTELGVRWSTSIEVLHLFSSNTTGILAASLAAWIINLVIPALIGSLLIFGIKFFRSR